MIGYTGSISASPTACLLRGYGRAGTQKDTRVELRAETSTSLTQYSLVHWRKPVFVRARMVTKARARMVLPAHGHNYISHYCIGRDHTGHSHVGQNYVGHSYKGHNHIGHNYGP